MEFVFFKTQAKERFVLNRIQEDWNHLLEINKNKNKNIISKQTFSESKNLLYATCQNSKLQTHQILTFLHRWSIAQTTIILAPQYPESNFCDLLRCIPFYTTYESYASSYFHKRAIIFSDTDFIFRYQDWERASVDQMYLTVRPNRW